MTVSVVTARPDRSSQRGSPYERLTRWAPARSAHSGWIAATCRAHSRFVSTSSAAMTHAGGFRDRASSRGRSTNALPRAPRYSRRSRSRVPTCDSSPASSDLMDVVRMRGVGAEPHTEVAGGPAELAVQVLPFADPQVVEELGPAQLAELVRRPLLLSRRAGSPTARRATAGRSPARRSGGASRRLAVRRVLRALPRVLDRQRRGDHEHLANAAEAVGLEHHAPEPRVDREPSEALADRGQPAVAAGPPRR